MDALVFVHNALAGAGLREGIRLIACGKVIDGFDMAAKIAAGADMCGSARGMMFALGCIQARRCHTNRCPVGVTTQDPWRVNGLVVGDKAQRVANYHASTVQHFLKVLAAAGLEHPEGLHPEILFRRISPHEIRSYAELYPQCPPGALHEGRAGSRYQAPWDAARAARF